MFYRVHVKDHIRVPPSLFGEDVKAAVVKRIKAKYDGYISKDLGVVIDVAAVTQVGRGVIILGDGAAYYETEFDLLTFKPEMQEVVYGSVKDIADFGAFMSIGAIDGMIHISQTMDDFVSFSKEKVLTGKDNKRVLKVGDRCKARIIAISFKDIANPKLGLTMRQQGLGKLDWLEEDAARGEGEGKKAEKPEKQRVKERVKGK